MKDNIYNLLKQEDITELDNLIDFSNNLILKNQELADSQETISSMTYANRYINAFMKVDELSDGERNKIIKDYKELNPYYKSLYEDYKIDYITSRTAKDYHIIKAMKPTLSKEEANLFYECYYEILGYYNKVTSTKAFNNQPLYRGYTSLSLIFSTINLYITKKLNSFFNIDLYSLSQLKNAFISYGLDYFDDIPINYQRRILKVINTLLSQKGTNRCITEIVKIFGFNNVDIYKYILAKGYNKKIDGTLDLNEPYLMFIKTPADKEVNFTNDIILGYESVTEGDPYWNTTFDAIVRKEFNMENSKYMSVDTTINAMKESIDLSYFMSLLQKFKIEYKEKVGENFGFLNKSISEVTIDVYDAIIALQSIVLRSNRFVDKINANADSINFIYGYNDIENKIDIKEIIDKILYQLKLHRTEIENYRSLKKFFEEFKMVGFNDRASYSIEEFITVYKDNQEIREQIELLIRTTNDYYLYKQLLSLWDIEMKTKTIKKLYGNATTYNEYIKLHNYDLYNYINLSKDISYTEKQKSYFYRDRIFVLVESIGNYISNLTVRNCFLNNQFIGITDYISNYIYILISIFKSYTVDLLESNIIFRLDDKTFNSLRLFDEYNLTSHDQWGDRLDLLDICNWLDDSKNIIKDSLNLTDRFSIIQE